MDEYGILKILGLQTLIMLGFITQFIVCLRAVPFKKEKGVIPEVI